MVHGKLKNNDFLLLIKLGRQCNITVWLKIKLQSQNYRRKILRLKALSWAA